VKYVTGLSGKAEDYQIIVYLQNSFMVPTGNLNKTKISVCISTRRRQEGLRRLLESLEKISIPPGTDVEVVIVENDTESNCSQMIRDYASGSRFRIKYYLEQNQGIVYARNRSVKEAGDSDFICFTDDDQIVSPEWLTELMKCQTGFDADGVAGPTKPIFGRKVPSYISGFYQPDTYPYGTVVKNAFTGCLILRKKWLDNIPGPFDIRLNFSGGEDSHLTKKISYLGGIIRFNPDAVAYEIIPEERLTTKYLIKRAFRTSNTALVIRSLEDKDFVKFSVLPRLIMRMMLGILIIIPCYIFGREDRLKGLMKIVKAFGGFSFIFGRKSRFYK